MAVVDIDKISTLLREASAEIILPRFQKLQDHEISAKSSPNDLVTHADTEMEAFLKRTLPDHLPGSVVIGEEGVSSGEDTLDILNDDTQKIWVVDPVDGTRNFVHGKETFGVMIACVINGQTQASWIYHVIQDQAYAAEKDSGAYRDNTRLQLEDSADISAMRVHINYSYFSKIVRPEVKTLISQFAEQQSLGSSAHEYTRLASGDAEASFYARSRVWDNLPGGLILQEAGGQILQMNKNPFNPWDDKAHLLVTTGPESWAKIHQLLSENATLSKFIEEK